LGSEGQWTAMPRAGHTVRDHQVSLMEQHRS
jgi:polyphosphate kinase